MPDMNGKELHEQMSKIHSNIKTLLMSGYPEDVISHHGVLDAEVNFIQKPFSLHDFVTKVRQVLDAKKS
jgi:FixJ family two-component response regulator